MRIPWKCPVCNGAGNVAPYPCHACNSKGIVVWEPDCAGGELEYQPVPPNRTFHVKTRYVYTGKGEPAKYIEE